MVFNGMNALVKSVTMGRIKAITAIVSLSVCQLVFASNSWYVVNNYTGTVGKYPVHVSLQTYTFGPHVDVKGSYYYDKHRAPIVLYGRETATGLTLCETTRQADFEKYLSVGEAYDLDACPFRLTNSDEGLTGVWQNNKARLPVSLSSTDVMDETQVIASEASIEIPFWGQTAGHSFIGVYENSDNGPVINRINVLDKKLGKVIQTINPQTENCDFGFYMTAIYQNIETDNDATVSFHCYSNKADISEEYTFNKQQGRYYPAQ